MSGNIFNKIALAIFIALMVFGLYSAFNSMDSDVLKEKFEENPSATGIGFFAFAQGLGATTPAMSFMEGNLQIPYPDSTDVFGLIFFAILGIFIIKITPALRSNYALAILVFILILLFGWVIWKLIMYYAFLWGGEQIGLDYLEATAIRNDILTKTSGALQTPLLVLSLLTFAIALKLIPALKN